MGQDKIGQYLNRGFIWDYSFKEPLPYTSLSFDKCKETFYKLLDQNVKHILDQNKKVLWTMSSGLDTSAILSHVIKYDNDPHTVCLDNGRTDVDFSIKLAKEWNLKNHNIVNIVPSSYSVEQDLLEMNSLFRSPYAHSYLFFCYNLFKYASEKGYDIVVMGDGPDVAMLGTHDLHTNIILTAIETKEYDLNLANDILENSNYVEHTVFTKEQLLYNSLMFNVGRLPIYNDEFFYFIWHRHELKQKYKIDEYRVPDNALAQRIYIEWEQFLVRSRRPADLLLTKFNFDQFSPYLESNLCQFMLSLPVHYRYTLNSTKHLMREIYGSYLPDFIMNKDRTGFNPNDIWAKEYFNVINYLLDGYVHNRSRKIHRYIDVSYLINLSEFTFNRKWALINLSMWMEKWL